METDTREAVISLQGIWASYETDTVLEDINFTLYKQDYVGLIGPNGGGKTTLIKVILGLVKPFRGKVTVLGESPQAGRRFVGYVPQLLAIDKSFPISIWDVVSMGRLKPNLTNLRLTDHDKQVIETSLRQVDMLDLHKRSINELSGGQRQRVFIARALAVEPMILLLDEPAASVDPQASSKLYELLEQLNEQISILLISHDMTAISAYVKSIGCINRRLVYHHEKTVTPEMLEIGYECPVDLIAHGLPHRVLSDHPDDQEGKND